MYGYKDEKEEVTALEELIISGLALSQGKRTGHTDDLNTLGRCYDVWEIIGRTYWSLPLAPGAELLKRL